MTAQASPVVGKGYTGGKGPLFLASFACEGQRHAAAAIALQGCM